MAGFTINGCGASDSYRTLKDLRVERCASCRKDTMHSLMELKMKIRVLYIPTIPIKTRYAVVCTRCKNGYYVSQEQRDFILSSPASSVVITDKGVKLIGMGEEKTALEAPKVPEQPKTPEKPQIQEQPPVQVQSQPQPPVQTYTYDLPKVQPRPLVQVQPKPPVQPQAQTYTYVQPPIQPQAQTYPYMPPQAHPPVQAQPSIQAQPPVQAQPQEQPKPEPQPEQPKPVAPAPQGADPMAAYRRRKVCPDCKLMFAPDKETCGICGSQLVYK